MLNTKIKKKNSEQTKVIFHFIWFSFVLNDVVLNDSIGATEYLPPMRSTDLCFTTGSAQEFL